MESTPKDTARADALAAEIEASIDEARTALRFNLLAAHDGTMKAWDRIVAEGQTLRHVSDRDRLTAARKEAERIAEIAAEARNRMMGKEGE